MPTFQGFPEGKIRHTPIPAPFFEDLLMQIDDVDELRITLYFIWRLDNLEGAFRFLTLADFSADLRLMHSLAEKPEKAVKKLELALEKAVSRGTMLQVLIQYQDQPETIYLLNSPKGRAAVRAIDSGQWQIDDSKPLSASLPIEQPNIYRIYEENIGPITPLLAQELSEAEDTYPIHWIEDAIRIAVEKNKRNWRYAAAILKRWQQEGRDGKQENSQDQRGTAEDRRGYIQGDYSDFIEH